MRTFAIAIALTGTVLLAACGPQEPQVAPPLPTNTPLPTFTPTPEIVVTPVDPSLIATAQAGAAVETAAAQTPVVVDAPAESGGDGAPSGEETVQEEVIQEEVVQEEPSPTPAQPVVVVDQGMNVRGGPGTNYQIIGAAAAGQQFPITGKNPAGDWWQINFNGQNGWIYGPLIQAENTEGVQVAANIPAPPPTATPAPATATPVPQQPTATPMPAQPTQPPAPAYRFNIAVVGRCDRQPAGTWFEGKTYVGGQPQSGHKVVFSYAPDGPWVTPPQISGPHEGYRNWDAGYYSHIISAAGPRAGTWYVWIVDDAGNRISEMAEWSSTGQSEGCNQAVVDFDSR